MNWQEIAKQEREKRTAIKALLGVDAPDMEQIKTLTEEAGVLNARWTAMKSNEAALGALATPVPPAPLPTGAEPEPPAADAVDPAIKTIYTLRYGTLEGEVKAVLTDLYGPHFEKMRIGQSVGFNRYLRYGSDKLTGEQKSLLSQVILTPEYAVQAIKSGRDVAEIKTVMVEAQDVLGGYIVPVDWQARVIQRLQGLTVMRGRALGITTSRDAVEMPTLTGGDSQYTSAVRVTWVDETPTAATADTNFTWGSERTAIHTVMAVAKLSQNLVEDAAVDIAGLLAIKFAEAAAVDEDNRFLTGDGNGKPQGILPSSANDLSLSEANSGSNTAVTWDGLIDLIYEPDSQYRGRCVFIAEKATYKAIAKLKDSNGQYLWRDRFGNNVSEGGEPVRLMGYSVFEQEAMPTIAQNAYPILFGDPMGYLIADRIGMSITRYIDGSLAETNQVSYVMKRRLGGQVIETYRWAVQKITA